MKQSNKRGFTLIELLVAVLIIGILAAVALPQYQKAIMKSRLAQWDVMFNTAQKAIDAYLLENGYPESETVYLTGKNRVGTIEMPGNCDIENMYCYTSAGRLIVICNSSKCRIDIRSIYNADGTTGNKTLGSDKPYVYLDRQPTGVYYFSSLAGKAGCQWVAERHPDIPVHSASITACKDTYGVPLPNPEYEE